MLQQNNTRHRLARSASEGLVPRETIVSNVAELSIAIDYEEPILTVESMIHH